MLATSYTFKRKQNTWVFNVILWIFLCLGNFVLFINFPLRKIDIIYSLSYLFSLGIPVAISVYFLVPKFFKKQYYFRFGLYHFLVFGFFMFLNTQYLENSIDFLFPNYYFISNYSLEQNFLIFFSISFFALSIKLVQDWVLHNHYEKEHIEQRLQALKSQINPHFLFNSLNVIYSLSIDKNQQVSDAVLQLSDILRYVIYDADRLTLISKEIELIKNYIAFEKNRHGKKENVLFETFLDEDSSIHPMLFLPLVENSFKHGLMSSIENPFIKIVLTKKKKLVHFYIENKFDKNNTFTKKVYGGVGIANVKKNLEIIYPDQYEFQKQINKEIYSVSLKINLN